MVKRLAVAAPFNLEATVRVLQRRSCPVTSRRANERKAIWHSRVPRSAASLKRCGLSRKKSLALRSIAESIASGTLAAREIERLPSSEALQRLVQLPGIGAWSAALVLLRGFGRVDVFPQADTGAESSLTALMRLHSRTALARVAERFAECRGYLYYYGLASRLLSARLIHAAPRAPARNSRIAVT